LLVVPLLLAVVPRVAPVLLPYTLVNPQHPSPNSAAGSGIELTQSQVTTLQALHARGYQIVAFPMYASHIGIRRGPCAALLAPLGNGTLEIYGSPGYVIGNNIAVRITEGPRSYFVWKQERLEATPDRLAELAAFTSDLETALLPHT
jgi:hypothetical protein